MQFSEKLSYISNREELSLFGVKNLQEQEVVSGGESTRIRLAELFSEQGTLHLLDEPTSHLRWLRILRATVVSYREFYTCMP